MMNPSLASIPGMLLRIVSAGRVCNGSALLLGKALLLGSALLIGSNWAMGHDGEDHEHKPRQVKPAEMFAPSNIPLPIQRLAKRSHGERATRSKKGLRRSR